MPANTDYQDTGFTVFSNVSLNGSAASLVAGNVRTSTISASGNVLASAFSSAGTTKSGTVWTSRLSVGGSGSGYTGTELLAFSFTTAVVPAMVVQGSASTFTVFVWPAVRVGDAIMVTPMANPGVSSISSGIIMHSHCTLNGQCELRYSNVSTLVQNQSAQTIGFYRWSAS
jgi:hypothetical protein